MSFRTVEIIGPAELHVKNGSLVIEKEIKEEKPAKVSEGTRKKKKIYYTGDNEKALPLQRMCTYAAGKGNEKSQGLIACQPLAM